MSDNKIPCFYTTMIDKLENLDNKVNEIQNSIRIFKAMISERIDVEELSVNNEIENNSETRKQK
tara:strand:+ start:1684 stop:1875 length:192 start_codon:yes stop_codon:yes gene_type:complete